ncbi:MAG TPA: hypothetical protein VJ830_07765 [Anaerolineales bacterium]|nr:hypothetical protein [Anaerolineales bacterium]
MDILSSLAIQPPNGERYPSRTPRSGSPEEGWWVGLGTILVLFRDETTLF